MTDIFLLNVAAYSLQVACIAALGSVLPAVLRVDAATRHFYWRILLAVCLVLPWLQGRHVQPAGGPIVETLAAVAPLGSAPAVAEGGYALPSIAWGSVALSLLAVGIVFQLLRVMLSLVRLRHLRTSGSRAQDQRGELQERLDVSAEIRHVPALRQPVTFGLRRPVVLLPDALQQQPDAVQRAVICHELVHVQRRDWAWLLAEEVTRAVLWFHPAIWWLLSRVQLTREEVVDSVAVVAAGSGRRTYIEALIAFADEPPLVPAAAFSRRRHLLRRIALLSKETVMSSKRVVLSCAVMFAFVLGAVLYTMAAFPLTAAAAAQVLRAQAGPLEARARPVTPENPIPRRTHSVAPIYPLEAEAVDMSGAVMLKVTLDASGRIAEIRRVAFAAMGGRPQVAVARHADAMSSVRDALGAAAETQAAADLVPAIEALFESAAAAVGQWQYDAPADAPIAFFLQIGFRAGAEGMLVAQDADWSNMAARMAAYASTPVPPAGGRASQAARERAQDPANQQAPARAGGARAGGPAGAPRPGAGSTAAAGATRPGAAAPAAGSVGPLRVGGAVRPPRKTHNVNAVYPPLARSAGVQGVVILEITIGADGRVNDARILRSIPLLDQAALDAVRQWEFEPVLLNGSPVPIVMTVTVNFSLAD